MAYKKILAKYNNKEYSVILVSSLCAIIIIIIIFIGFMCKEKKDICAEGCYEYNEQTKRGRLIFRNNNKAVIYQEDDNRKIYYNSMRRIWYFSYLKEKQYHYIFVRYEGE